MTQVLRLGLRLALGGGREGLVRMVFMTAGVGLGVALILLSLTAPRALLGRSDRMAWQDAAYSAQSPETEDDPIAESVDGALFLAVSDYYDGQPMTRAYLAALGADPPVPPGLDRAPGPGEVAASPALRRLIESTPDDELRDRFPGRITMTIGPEGLAHDNDLVGIIGRTPQQLNGVRSVAKVHGFTDVRPTGWVISVFLAVLVLQGTILVLVPVVLVIVVVTRVSWRQRERRLAAIRLVGATQAQIALVAAVEAGVATVAGAAVGWGLYEVGRRVLAATVIFQYGHFWVDDLALPPWWLAGILLGTPVLVILVTVASLRHVQARPLAVQLRSRRGRLSFWFMAPLIVGILGQFVLLPFRERLAVTTADESLPPPVAAIGVALTLATIVGFFLAGPLLVDLVGRGIARLSRGVPSLLAARRIGDNPQATFNSVAIVALAAIGLAYVGCTAAINAPPTSSAPDSPWNAPLRPGVVAVMTGGVPAEAVAPLLTGGAVVRSQVLACQDLARVKYVTCPYPPGSGLAEPTAGAPAPPIVGEVFIPTDATLAAENRVRTVAANLVPNAIINSDRDPVDGGTFIQDLDALVEVAALFVLLLGAFGLAASTAGGLIERKRPLALLRTAGVHMGELRRSVLLETAATMTVVSIAGAALGMLLAYISTRHFDMAWRWPGPDMYGFLGGAVLAALLFSAIALPLLNLTTRHDAVRFE